MNSRIKNHSNPLMCGLGDGINSLHQMKVLDQMEAFLTNLSIFDQNVNGGLKKSPMPWQTGMMCSIYSIRALHQDLVVNGDYKYILTSRVNQDALENFFSRIRGKYTHLKKLPKFLRLDLSVSYLLEKVLSRNRTLAVCMKGYDPDLTMKAC